MVAIDLIVDGDKAVLNARSQSVHRLRTKLFAATTSHEMPHLQFILLEELLFVAFGSPTSVTLITLVILLMKSSIGTSFCEDHAAWMNGLSSITAHYPHRLWTEKLGQAGTRALCQLTTSYKSMCTSVKRLAMAPRRVGCHTYHSCFYRLVCAISAAVVMMHVLSRCRSHLIHCGVLARLCFTCVIFYSFVPTSS